MTKKKQIHIPWKDIAITFAILGIATLICFVLKMADRTAAFASMVFILAVFLISVFTKGYFFGISSSFIAVLMVNFIFTYPFFAFNFMLSGYPLTITCMLAVSVVTCTRTTKLKQHEDIKIEAEREKTRSNLLRAVSHDLRTPLTSIIGACSAIIENDSVISSEERIKLLSEAKEDSEWLIRMVENLLAITRIDMNGENDGKSAARITKELEAVEEIVADCASKFRKRFPDISLNVSVPDELLMVSMDATLIEQVVMNLLENAVYHSHTATEIVLSVKRNTDSVSFSVCDNGKGIPANILPHIFDGYFNKSYERGGDAKHNMGIGLSVCNTIIRAHNGTMTASNLEKGGACFAFTLPMNENVQE